jgi:hypothetical protein
MEQQLIPNSITIDRAKELIHTYQETRDPQVYKQILAKFDRWIIYLLRKIEWFSWLRGEDSQDLYGEALIGFHKGVLALPHDWEGNKIYLFLGGYVKNELRNKYRFKIFEVNARELVHTDTSFVEDDENTSSKSMQDHVFHQYEAAESQYKKDRKIAEVNLLINTPGLLTPIEKRYIELFYLQGFDGPKVAEIMVQEKLIPSCSRQWVSHEVRRILIKLKDHIEDERA